MLVKSKAKYIQSLGQKKHRDEEGLFIAEGPKIVAEMISTVPEAVQEVYALREWISSNENKLAGKQIQEVSADELGKISQLSTANNVLAVLKKFPSPVIRSQGTISLVLDGIQDPGNLGTIIRIADWFGISQLICSPECADQYNPKVVQSTMGSILRVKLLYTGLEEWLSAQSAIAIYAAALSGKDVTAMKKIKEGIIVIGNESKGISNDIFQLVNVKITIPGKGHAESLNAAVATGIILSHLT